MVDYAVAGIALASLAYGVASGERQANVQRQGRRSQEQAQKQAETAVVREARTAEEADNRAKQKTPDLNVLLADELQPKPGKDSIDANRLLLGRPGLLG